MASRRPRTSGPAGGGTLYYSPREKLPDFERQWVRKYPLPGDLGKGGSKFLPRPHTTRAPIASTSHTSPGSAAPAPAGTSRNGRGRRAEEGSGQTSNRGQGPGTRDSLRHYSSHRNGRDHGGDPSSTSSGKQQRQPQQQKHKDADATFALNPSPTGSRDEGHAGSREESPGIKMSRTLSETADILKVHSTDEEGEEVGGKEEEEEEEEETVEELRAQLKHVRAERDEALARASDADEARDEYRQMMKETVELARRWKEKHTSDQARDMALNGLKHRDMDIDEFLKIAAGRSRELESRRGFISISKSMLPASRSGTADMTVSALQSKALKLLRPRTAATEGTRRGSEVAGRSTKSSLSFASPRPGGSRPGTSGVLDGVPDTFGRMSGSRPGTLGLLNGRPVTSERMAGQGQAEAARPGSSTLSPRRARPPMLDHGMFRPDSALTQDSPGGVVGGAGPTSMGFMHRDTPTPTRSPRTNSPASPRSRTEASPNRDEGGDRSPQPRFWGQGDRVEKLTLDKLRHLVHSLGDEEEEGRGGGGISALCERQEERQVASARHRMEEERREIDEFRSRAVLMNDELFGSGSASTTGEVVECFEGRMPDIMRSDVCTVYFIDRATKCFHCSRHGVPARRVTLREGMSGMGEAQVTRRSCVANQWDASRFYSAELDKATNLFRMSAMWSPCLDRNRQVVAVVEVCQVSVVPRVYSRSDRKLLELACSYFMQALYRSEQAQEMIKAQHTTDLIVASVIRLTDERFERTVMDIADRCRELVHAKRVTVWIVDEKDRSRLYNTTLDESDCRIAHVGVGFAGTCCESKHLENIKSDNPSSVCMVAPIVAKSGDSIAVLECEGKAAPEPEMWQWPPPGVRFVSRGNFSTKDEALVMAFCAVLANFMESSRWTVLMRQQVRNLVNLGAKDGTASGSSAILHRGGESPGDEA